MLINRDNLSLINEIFNRVADTRFNISTQYKLIKLKKAIQEENEIYLTQLDRLKDFFLTDENGNYIQNENGGYAIDQNRLEECKDLIDEVNALQVQVPDLYFSLDELEPLNLSFKELEALDPFIKI